jgi:uncharacterized protein with ATP-grasp and redox domains
MKTYLECIPCFFNQCIQIGQTAGLDELAQKRLIDKVARQIPNLPPEMSPPEMAGIILEVVRTELKINDPYQKEKERSSQLVKALLPEINQLILEAENPLLMAVELAIAGNIIDYGANNQLDLRAELTTILKSEQRKIAKEAHQFFDFDHFVQSLSLAKALLYIGDNVGEHYFDAQLIQQLKQTNPQLTIHYATRGYPALNDVLLADAKEAEIDKWATLLSSGSKLPGTVLSQCTPEFNQIFDHADLIISKGQGNYETLSNSSKNIYFLLMAKCPIIARDVGCELRDILLLAPTLQD